MLFAQFSGSQIGMREKKAIFQTQELLIGRHVPLSDTKQKNMHSSDDIANQLIHFLEI